MKRTPLIAATGLALGTALLSGVSNFVAKISVTVVKDPIVFTTLKNVLVAALLFGIVVVARQWSDLVRLRRDDWLKLAAIGLIGGSVPFALFFIGLTKTSALNASLIHKSLFLWVLLLAIPILRERMTRWQWVGIATVVAANLFVGGFNGFRYNLGELMVLAATFLWAVESVIAKIALRNLSSLIVAAARMVFGSAILIVFIALRGGGAAVIHLTAVQWGWTLLSTGLLVGYVLTWYAALKRAPATYVATLLVPATLVTNVLSAVFITHAFPVVQVMNGFFLIIGAVLLIRFTRRAVSDSVAPQLASHE